MTYLLRQSLRNIILTMGYFCSLIINKFLGKINNLQYNRYARCWLISCTSFRTIYIYTCTVIYKFTFDYLYDPSYFFFTYVRKIKLKDEKNLVTIHASDP